MTDAETIYQSEKTEHRFLDEAGDTTFYGAGKTVIIGNNGVSKAFIIGMVKFYEPLAGVREKVMALARQVSLDPYFQDIPSIKRKMDNNSFYFHATDDVPEVRKLFFDLIKELDCSFEAVVGRKIPAIYERKHHGNESEFYADILSHLLKNKLQKGGKLVLDIASRGKSTKNQNLQAALNKAIHRHHTNSSGKPVATNVIFNVQNHHSEPLLNISDYFCWAIQRLFEKGEIRYYNFVKDKVKLVVDLYESEKYEGNKNYYTPKKPLTVENWLK